MSETSDKGEDSVLNRLQKIANFHIQGELPDSITWGHRHWGGLLSAFFPALVCHCCYRLNDTVLILHSTLAA